MTRKIIALATEAIRVEGVWGLHQGPDGLPRITHLPTGRAAWKGVDITEAQRLLDALGTKLPRLAEGVAFGGVPDDTAMTTLRAVIATVCK